MVDGNDLVEASTPEVAAEFQAALDTEAAAYTKALDEYFSDPARDYVLSMIRKFAATGSYSACFLEMDSAEKLAQWAKDQGVPNVVAPDRMHCTIHHSETQGVGPDYQPLNQRITVDNYEGLEQFGPDKEILVLVLDPTQSNPMLEQHHRVLDSGAVLTTPRPFVAHVTLSYDAPEFAGTAVPDFPITFGPEAVGQVDDELQRNFINVNHLPAGSAQGGEFAPKEGGLESLGYKRDNPGGSWLKEKQQNAEQDMKRMPAKSTYGKGLGGAATAYLPAPSTGKRMYLPAEMVAALPGASDEKRGPGELQYDELLRAVEKNGWDQKYPVMITVNHQGKAFLYEGNTRAAVAKKLGKPLMAEVQWMNGGENVPGDWTPKKVAAAVLSEHTS